TGRQISSYVPGSTCERSRPTIARFLCSAEHKPKKLTSHPMADAELPSRKNEINTSSYVNDQTESVTEQTGFLPCSCTIPQASVWWRSCLIPIRKLKLHIDDMREPS